MFKILLIDDLETLLMLVSQLITSRPGFEVRCAGDGETGVALARSEPPDLILLDVAMSEVGGEEVLAQLKADPRTADVPVVIMSGSSHNAGIQSMLDHGAADFLPKPFSARTLYATVDAFKDAALASLVPSSA